ncbi:MAG TPA: protein kinase [Myxococcota bacterium]|nr:protein kinase [Myxococcota bacterium]HRY93717.1 protein kinase [Myxococcota bacterium]
MRLHAAILVLLSTGWLLAGPVGAAPPSPPLDLTGALTREAVETLDGWMEGLPWALDWDALLAELEKGGPGELARYARAASWLARGSAGHAEAALDELRALRAAAPPGLAANLLVSIGRWQLQLRHPGDALASLEAAAVELRRLKDGRGLARALYLQAMGLIAQSRRPCDALPIIDELLVVAHLAGLPRYTEAAERLQGEWRKAMDELEDYFGRARARLSTFPPSIGIPEDADLVAFVPGGLLMNGDTDDQVSASAPRLALFDGLLLRTRKLPEDDLELRGSAVDGRGRVWVATQRGLYLLDDDRFSHLVNPALPDEAENGLKAALARPEPAGVGRRALGLPSNVVNEVKPGPDGRLYLATDAGLAIWDEASGALEVVTDRDAPIARKLERVAPVPGGEVVVAWRDEYAVRDRSGRWQRFPFEFPALAGKASGKLFGLLVDAQGRAWVHGLLGALRLEGAEITRVVDRSFQAMTRNVNHVLIARDGASWFATPDGVCRQQGRGCAALDEGRWLAAEWTLDLLEGQDGAVFVSAYLGGLYRLAAPHYRTYGMVDGFVQPMNTTVELQAGALTFVQPRGLTRLEPRTGRFDHYLFGNEGLPRGVVSTPVVIWLADGRLAMVDPEIDDGKRLILFDGRQGSSLGPEDGLPEERVRSLCEVAPGRLWLATKTGVHELELASRALRPAPGLEALAGHEVTTLVCAPGEPVWLATQDDQVWSLEGGRAARLDLAGLGLSGKPRGLLRSPTAGRILVGERDVLRFAGGAWSRVPVEAESFDFRVRDVELDGQGVLFFATESGVLATDGESWTRLGVADGLITDSAHEMVLHEGRLWITGNGGVVDWGWPASPPPETFLRWSDQVIALDPQGRPRRYRVSDGVEKPGWVLLRGLAGALEVPEDEAGPTLAGLAGVVGEVGGEPPPVVIDRDRLELQVRAGTPWEDDKPSELTCFHRLDGGPWTRVEGLAFELRELADGEHLLEVRATDRNLRRDPTPARLRFRVDTPVSPWQVAAAGLLVVGLVGWNRRRLRDLWRRYQHRSFRPIEPSPFHPGRPAEGAQLVGREAELAEIQALARSGGSAAAVWGPRGSGKHSFVRAVAGRLRQDGVLVVAADLAAASAGADAAALIAGLANQLELAAAEAGLAREAEPGLSLSASGVAGPRLDEPVGGNTISRNPDSPSGPGSSESNPFQRLGRCLARLERARPGLRVALLLDNAEALGMAADADAAFGSFLFPFLRSLVQERPSLCLVLALEGHWFDLSRRFEALFAFASPLHMGRLPDDLVRALFADAFHGRAFLDERALGLLVALAGGRPDFCQLMGQRLVESLNAEKTNLCSPALLENAADALVAADPDRRMESSWLQLNREEQLVVCALAEGGPLGPEAILARLLQAEVRLLPEELRRTLLALERSGLVVPREGLHALRGELARRWILRHHDVGSVASAAQEYVGAYQLLDKLGAGGMGMVYKARDMAHGTTVALKLLRPELAEHKRSRQRFLREARLGKRVRHPNVVRILDYGEQGGKLYLAMDFLEGHSLARWARSPRRPGPRALAEVGRALASALGAIHKLGVVHRDVKPENVMVVGEADPAHDPLSAANLRLMDFGLAVGEDVSRVTRAGSLLGTLMYMAPEQARGQEVDPRADLYSLGALLYELWTGRTPFAGNEAVVLDAVLNHKPVDAVELRPGLPAPLAELVRRLMEKEAARRPASAAELEQLLDAMLPGLPADELSVETALPAEAGPAVGVTDAPTRAGVMSRALDAMKLESRLLGSLSSAALSSVGDGLASLDKERALLYRVSAIVARGPVTAGSLDEILGLTRAAMGASGGLVAQLGAASALSISATLEHPPGVLESSEVLGPLVRQCVEQRMGVLYLGEPDAPAEDLGACAAAPLWAGEQILGALLVDRRGPSARPFEDSDLELLVCVGYLVGLGVERERLLKQALDQERLAAVGQMLAGVAHDLKNPMAVVYGYAEMLEEPLAPERTAAAARIIRRQVDEMLDMIGNLLAFSRGKRELALAEIQPKAFAEEIRENLDVACRDRQVVLRLEADGEPVRLDPSRLKRIVLNLSKNALEALGGQGQLEIHLVGAAAGLSLEVRDSGPGLPAEVQQRLFEPFVTQGKVGGTGLGLAIVKRFVDDHKGDIQVESVRGQGTCFRIHLPAPT